MTTRLQKKKMDAISDANKAYFKDLIKPLNEGQKDILQMFEEFKNEVVVKLQEKIFQQDEKIQILESKIELKNNLIEKLLVKTDDVEQYSRRSCLRINGVAYDESKSEDVSSLVADCYKSVGVAFDPNCIDRCHRIGKPITNTTTGQVTKQIIVRYQSWNSRTSFYKKRPKWKPGQNSFSVSLDLTQRRYGLLKYAKEAIKSYPSVDFVFADVNCSLALKLNDNSFWFFNDESQLNKILTNQVPG